MKKLFLFIGVILSGLILVGCVNNFGNPKIAVSPQSFDFGEITQKEDPVSTRVVVENVGGKPLTIDKLSTSCGCTVAEMDMSDLQVAEKRELKITFDPMVHPDQFGPITRVVYLQTNDPENPEIEIDISGNVIQ